MAIFFVCPVCKNDLTLTDDRAGTSFECPTCKTDVAVPTLLPPLPVLEPEIAEPSIEFLSPGENAIVGIIVDPEPVPQLPAPPPELTFVDYTPDLDPQPGTPGFDDPDLKQPLTLEEDEAEEESDEALEWADDALSRRTREYKRRRARRRAIILTALPLILLVILWLLYPGVMERWRYFQSHPAPNSSP